MNTHHYSHFGRKVYRGPPVDISKVKRDYDWDDEDFKRALDKYNDTIAWEQYECVGYANVRLQFCSLCFDVEKEGKHRELYYVNKVQVLSYKMNICHGCLGHKLRNLAE